MVTISAGSGTSGMGGALSLLSGRSTVHTGGSVSIESGEGTSSSSGVIAVRSANAGTGGEHGWCSAQARPMAGTAVLCIWVRAWLREAGVAW